MKYYTYMYFIKIISLYQYICHIVLACKSFCINLFSDVYSSLEVYIIIENKIKLQQYIQYLTIYLGLLLIVQNIFYLMVWD